jgi:hypothetical protein
LGRQTAKLILAVALAVVSAGASARQQDLGRPVAQTPWAALKPEERHVLGPVADRWETFPGYQQQRLITSARRYPSLQPIQKERFDSRLRTWAEMTPDQRRAARETYQDMRRLSPAQQHELRERWLRQHQQPEEASEPLFEQPPPPPQRPAPGPVAPDYTRRR